MDQLLGQVTAGLPLDRDRYRCLRRWTSLPCTPHPARRTEAELIRIQGLAMQLAWGLYMDGVCFVLFSDEIIWQLALGQASSATFSLLPSSKKTNLDKDETLYSTTKVYLCWLFLRMEGVAAKSVLTCREEYLSSPTFYMILADPGSTIRRYIWMVGMLQLQRFRR